MRRTIVRATSVAGLGSAAGLGLATALLLAPGAALADATVTATTTPPGGPTTITVGCGADATSASVSGTSWGGPSEIPLADLPRRRPGRVPLDGGVPASVTPGTLRGERHLQRRRGRRRHAGRRAGRRAAGRRRVDLWWPERGPDRRWRGGGRARCRRGRGAPPPPAWTVRRHCRPGGRGRRLSRRPAGPGPTAAPPPATAPGAAPGRPRRCGCSASAGWRWPRRVPGRAGAAARPDGDRAAGRPRRCGRAAAGGGADSGRHRRDRRARPGRDRRRRRVRRGAGAAADPRT